MMMQPGPNPNQQQQQQQQMPPYAMGTAGMPPPSAAMQQQQQQPQGVQQMQPGGGAPGGMVGAIHAKLASVVAANQLQRFYPPQALQALASRLDGRVNFRDLAARCVLRSLHEVQWLQR
jgi:hypothetical protein